MSKYRSLGTRSTAGLGKTKEYTESAPVTTSRTRPEKFSMEYFSQVLESRGVTFSDSSDFSSVFNKIRLPRPRLLKSLLGDAYVDFESSKLVTDCQHGIQGRWVEAEWTASILHRFFLRSNSLARQSGVIRKVQFKYIWSGPFAKICLPPPVTLDLLESMINPCTQVWLEDSEKFSLPDHVYFIGGQFDPGYAKLPAFRNGIFHDDTLVSYPPYLVTEDKPTPDRSKNYGKEAEQYIAFVLCALLHDQLLLWSLTEEAQKTSTIPFHEFKIFGMTNCGHQVKIFQMSVRPYKESQKTPNKDKPPKPDYIRYLLTQIAELNLVHLSDCDKLKTWVNHIHNWGSTIHKESLAAKAAEVRKGGHVNTESWKKKLDRTVFIYDTKEKIAFQLLGSDNHPLFLKPPIINIDTHTTNGVNVSQTPEVPTSEIDHGRSYLTPQVGATVGHVVQAESRDHENGNGTDTGKQNYRLSSKPPDKSAKQVAGALRSNTRAARAKAKEAPTSSLQLNKTKLEHTDLEKRTSETVAKGTIEKKKPLIIPNSKQLSRPTARPRTAPNSTPLKTKVTMPLAETKSSVNAIRPSTSKSTPTTKPLQRINSKRNAKTIPPYASLSISGVDICQSARNTRKGGVGNTPRGGE
ncbi:hypothetical protein ACEPPN_002228 [Leptodophora sp. 'Broadleaf-Isolate-01']